MYNSKQRNIATVSKGNKPSKYKSLEHLYFKLEGCEKHPKACEISTQGSTSYEKSRVFMCLWICVDLDSFIYFCACGLVEQVCLCQASVQYDTDFILLWRDPCVLILFRRVSVAFLYPVWKIHRRDLEGLCLKHANICVMWNRVYTFVVLTQPPSQQRWPETGNKKNFAFWVPKALTVTAVDYDGERYNTQLAGAQHTCSCPNSHTG